MNYAYWFANIPGLSNCAKISIHEKVGNAQDIYFLSEKQMENMQLLAKEIQAVRAAQKTDMEEAYAKMCESGISFVSLEDASYPKRLRHIANPPYGLYVKGCLPQGETVAIVGARMCSEYGRTVARELGRMLAARGVGVVSGMARGIDAAGHQGALDVGGISCAVLGCGVDVCYPKSSRVLYEEILERGSVVSEYPPGTQPIPGYFPAAQPHHIRACPGGCCGGGKAAERIADHGGFCAGAGEGCLCHSGQNYRCLVGGMQQLNPAGSGGSFRSRIVCTGACAGSRSGRGDMHL